MATTALDLWTAVLTGLGLAGDEAKRVLTELATKYPDLAAFEAAVEDYISTQLGPSLTTLPARLKNEAVAWYQAGGASPVSDNPSNLA